MAVRSVGFVTYAVYQAAHPRYVSVRTSIGTVRSLQKHIELSFYLTAAPVVPSSVPVDVVVTMTDPEIRQREHPLPGDDRMRTLGKWRAE